MKSDDSSTEISQLLSAASGLAEFLDGDAKLEEAAEQAQERQLESAPDFVVVGAPRAGTTWLFDVLRHHPGIFLTERKELKYFSSRLRWLEMEDYQSLFASAGGRLRGDITPSYYSLPPGRLEALRSLKPSLRVIYSLRDPIARAWSEAKHYFSTTGQSESLRTPDLVMRYLLSDGAVLSSRYSLHLRRWLDCFGPDQVRAVFQEDLAEDPKRYYGQVLQFLGLTVPSELPDEFQRRSNAGSVGHGLAAPIREMLSALFYEEYSELADLLRRTWGTRLPPAWHAPAERPLPMSLVGYGPYSRVVLWRSRFVYWRQTSPELHLDDGTIAEAVLKGRAVVCDTADEARGAAFLDAFRNLHYSDLAECEPDGEMTLLAANYRGYNLTLFRGRFYALAVSLGHVDLETMTASQFVQLSSRSEILVAEEMAALRARIAEAKRREQGELEAALAHMLPGIDAAAVQLSGLVKSDSGCTPEPPSSLKVLEGARWDQTSQPWLAYPHSNASINPIPTFLCPEETRFLAWLCATRYRGEGAIIDINSINGGATHAMAFGLSQKPPTRGPHVVHSYDPWRYHDGWERYFPGLRLSTGDRLYPHFVSNLKSLASRVEAHEGLLLDQAWCGKPIEVLFLGNIAAPEEMLHVVRAFYPHLIVSQSTLVVSGMVSGAHWWIQAIQEHLSPFFEILESPEGGTVCFRLINPLPEDPIPKDFLVRLGPRRIGELILGMARRLGGWYSQCVQLACAGFLAVSGSPEAAAGILELVSTKGQATQQLQFDVAMVQAAIQSARTR